jgi:hypothetical protein
MGIIDAGEQPNEQRSTNNELKFGICGLEFHHRLNSLRFLCDLCDFAFPVMDSTVATLEYDAETPRTQRNRKGSTSSACPKDPFGYVDWNLKLGSS